MPNEFMTRFELVASFQKATEAFEEIRAEAQREFVALWPLQARIRQRVLDHILMAPMREETALLNWRHNASIPRSQA